MSSLTFDTLEFVKAMESAGMPARQAEALSTALRKTQERADVATKADVVTLEASTDSKFDLLRKDMDSGFALVRKDIEAVEQRLDAKIDRLDAKFDQFKWLMGFMLAGVISLVVKAFL